MIIECFDGGIVRLTEPFDFRNFKLALHADANSETQGWKGITLLDDRDALVSIDLVPTLAGRPDDASWDRRYAEMVAKARQHGWIDAERQAIRAHIERAR
ncbi:MULTISPECIES: hypothetical protein [unclassified Bradyrhizobium]|uniref:hypothetical protein n=1 Tax=unclassified Bradyrhizobium TaxID=2631580 RepID=UPI000368B042|nr:MULTISPECIES: hypothetical protein [unclassified Bradyrhizobium]MBB4256362.1 hypothetical protein [Bradyrhizobium sp. CIR3A]MBB4378949.1 hypothetical protein [Bradyrhizobium sp. SBR1B]MBB4397402.1 hypothetical protein [Bradyrhizobium sp. ERR14]MBB4425652.1 hypothetical protein [Bradyrhizobium sp. CIR48]NYG43611.1 hypothetical protein [Bradyrhizobium sp. IAR9]